MELAGQSLSVGLNAVILSVDSDTPRVLIVPQSGGGVALLREIFSHFDGR